MMKSLFASIDMTSQNSHKTDPY